MDPVKPNAIPQVQGQPGQQTGQWAKPGEGGLEMSGRMGQPLRPVVLIELSNGMRFEVQEPSASDMYRMARVLNGVPATDMRQNYAMALFCIVSFNGRPMMKPKNEIDIEMFLEQLGPAHVLSEFLEKLAPVVETYHTPDKKEIKNS